MIELATIAAALTVLKQGGDAAKTGIEAYNSLKETGKDSDLAEVQAVAGRLAEELFRSRATNLEVQTKLQDFQAEAKAQEDFEDTKRKYALFKTEFGAEVWELVEETDCYQLHQYVCPNCLVKVKDFYPLQKNGDILNCHNCKDLFRLRSSGVGGTFGRVIS